MIDKSAILDWLGYESQSDIYSTYLTALNWIDSLEETSFLYQEIETALRDLSDIKNQLRLARQDSMAMSVGAIKLNYNSHVKHLHFDGIHTTDQLAKITSTPVLSYRFANLKRPVSYVG